MSMIDTDILNPSIRGQTRGTWRNETTLRGVLMRLIQNHPDWDKTQIRDLFLEKTEMVPQLIEEALVRAFDNDWAAIHKPKPREHTPDYEDDVGNEAAEALPMVKPKQQRSKPSPEQVAAEANAVVTTVDLVKDLMLFDLIQPNGKKLRDCSGTECGEFGGWYLKLRDRFGDNVLGVVTTEDEVRRMRETG